MVEKELFIVFFSIDRILCYQRYFCYDVLSNDRTSRLNDLFSCKHSVFEVEHDSVDESSWLKEAIRRKKSDLCGKLSLSMLAENKESASKTQ
jgi:hypothetical protein